MQVMKQLPLFKRLLQEAASGNDESEDIAKGLARVFAEVGEAYVSLIAAGMPFHHCPRPAVPTKANQVVLQQVQKVHRGDIFDCLRLGRVASPHGTAEAQTMTQVLHARWRNVASRHTHTIRAVSVPDLHCRWAGSSAACRGHARCGKLPVERDCGDVVHLLVPSVTPSHLAVRQLRPGCQLAGRPHPRLADTCSTFTL